MRVLFAVIFLLASILLIGLGQSRRLARIEFSDKQPSGWSINKIRGSYSTLYHLSGPDGIYRGMVRVRDNRLYSVTKSFEDHIKKSSDIFLKGKDDSYFNTMKSGKIDIGWTTALVPNDRIKIPNVKEPQNYMSRMYFIRNAGFTLTANLYFKQQSRNNDRKFREFLCRLMKFHSPEFINQGHL